MAVGLLRETDNGRRIYLTRIASFQPVRARRTLVQILRSLVSGSAWGWGQRP